MPLRMRHWTGIVATAMALLAIWGLPPIASPGFFASAPKYADQIVSERLSKSVMQSNEILKRLRWADSLTAIAAALPPGAVFVKTPGGARPDDQTLAAFHDRISQELESGPARDANMRLGFILQRMTHGSHPDVPNPSWPMETYLGERNGNPYCLSVYAAGLPRRDFDWIFRAVWPSNRKASLLGQCRLPARYGMPGPQIMEWLEAGGMSLATGSAPDGYFGPGRRPWGAAQTPFAMRRAQRDQSWRRDVDVDRCITGDVAACAHLLTPRHLGRGLNPQYQAVVSATPLTHVDGSRRRSDLAFLEAYILAQLEDEFGSDRFLDFWTSEQSFEDAFEDAFGVETGVWMSRWVNQWLGEYPAGPAPTRSAGLGSVLLISLCAGFAGLWARRRKVH